jgi:hypothetical protein
LIFALDLKDVAVITNLTVVNDGRVSAEILMVFDRHVINVDLIVRFDVDYPLEVVLVA